jgi:hypothetical protein
MQKCSTVSCFIYLFRGHVLNLCLNRIGGLMVSVLVSSAVDRGSSPDLVKTKTIKLVFVAFSLNIINQPNLSFIHIILQHIIYWLITQYPIKMATIACSSPYIRLHRNLMQYSKNKGWVSEWVSEWVSDILRKHSNFSAISWQEQVNFQWDDDEVRFALDQYA